MTWVGCVVRLGKYRLFFLLVNLRATANCMRQRCQSFGAGGTFDTFLGAFAKLRKATISFIMSVHLSAWNDSFIFEYLSKILPRKFMLHLNRRRIAGTFHEDCQTYLIVSRSLFLRMKNVSDKFVEEIKTHILCPITFFLNRTVYEIMWKSTV